MKLDTEYLKSLLLAIENTPSPRPGLRSIVNAMGLEDINDTFVLHYEVLADYEFIEGSGHPKNIGLFNDYDGLGWTDANIRLTAKGHEFSANLRQSEIWDALKEKFKEDSVDTLFMAAKKLAANIAKKKLEGFLNIELD